VMTRERKAVLVFIRLSFYDIVWLRKESILRLEMRPAELKGQDP
jgi:hypothetical protein